MLGNLFNGTKPTDNTTLPSQPPVAPTSDQNQVGITPNVPVQPIVAPSVPAVGETPPTPPQTPAVPDSAVPPVATNSTNPVMDPTRREDLSALSHLDSRAMQVVAYAQQEAIRIHQSIILPEYILLGLLNDSEITKLLQSFSVDIAKLSRELQAKETTGTFNGQPTLSDDVKQIFESAFAAANDRNSSFITPEDILVSIFASSIGATLQTEGVDKDDVVAKLSKSAAFTEGRKSLLEKFGTDLTAKAKEGLLDPVAGRENEVDRLIHILLRRTKNNPIIIGEAGVGKTAIVEGLAQAIVSGAVPDELKNKKIFQIEVSSLIAGATHRGEFEERLRSVMRDVMSASGQIILFIDEIHTLIGTGDNEGGMDASNIIKPNLARGQLQIIGTTTTAEYRKYFEKDKAFARRFQSVTAEEPSEEVAIKMLQALKAKYEKYHNVTIPDDAITAAVKLSKKYIGERYLPDKAVDLLDEAAAEVKLEHAAGKRQDTVIAKGDIEKVVSSWTGIPITKLTEDESQKLLELEKRIHQRLVDQNPAVSSVAEAVRRGRIGLASANRPIASFIFLGPTGTGKTELAKTLAEILFGRDDAMVRLDMSEYMEKHEVAKLIGAPPGYVGYEEGGQLTEAVRAKPYSIVLLDEVEKAHPDVFNILLQLLEDGRLTDNKGNTISFKNTIVIATSNIGSQDIQEQLSKPAKTPEEFEKMYKDMQAKVSEDLHKFFRPELLNRFDEIVMFQPLRQEDMKYIAKLGIEKTGSLLKEQGFDLRVTDPALDILAKEGYDPQYGARPLRRLIQTAIENPIAMMLIQKTFVQGDTIQIDYDQQKATFTFVKFVPVPATATDQVQPVPAVETPVVAQVAPVQPVPTEQVVVAQSVQQMPPENVQVVAAPTSAPEPQVPATLPPASDVSVTTPVAMPTEPTSPVQAVPVQASVQNELPTAPIASTVLPTQPVITVETIPTQNVVPPIPVSAQPANKIMQTTADVAATYTQTGTQQSTQQAINEAVAAEQSFQQLHSPAAISEIASATELPVNSMTIENAKVQASLVDQMPAQNASFATNTMNFAPPVVASAGLLPIEENKEEVA